LIRLSRHVRRSIVRSGTESSAADLVQDVLDRLRPKTTLEQPIDQRDPVQISFAKKTLSAMPLPGPNGRSDTVLSALNEFIKQRRLNPDQPCYVHDPKLAFFFFHHLTCSLKFVRIALVLDNVHSNGMAEGI